jgi:hypothetical protein
MIVNLAKICAVSSSQLFWQYGRDDCELTQKFMLLARHNNFSNVAAMIINFAKICNVGPSQQFQQCVRDDCELSQNLWS